MSIKTMIGSVAYSVYRKCFDRGTYDGGYFFGGSDSGVYVSPESAMKLSAVYACVKVISEDFGALPCHLYRLGKDGSREIAIGHPLEAVLHGIPNPDMTSQVFRETIMANTLLWGNGYAQITRNRAGQIVSMTPLSSDRVEVIREDDGSLSYKYWYSSTDRFNGRDADVTFSQDAVFHMPGLSYNGVYGLSPIAVAKNTIGLTAAAEEYGASFFKGGAVPSGIITSDQTLKPEAVKKLKESWDATYGRNGSRRGGTAILENGLKYQQVSMKPEEAQFIETRNFQIPEICRIFRVPPHMICALDKATFSNIEQQAIEYVSHTLVQWVTRYEQNIARCCMTADERREYFVKLNVDGLLRGEFESRMRGYAIGRQNGWLSANDIRAKEDLPLIAHEDGGDDYLVNGNMMRIADAGAAYRSIGAGSEDNCGDAAGTERSGNVFPRGALLNGDGSPV